MLQIMKNLAPNYYVFVLQGRQTNKTPAWKRVHSKLSVTQLLENPLPPCLLWNPRVNYLVYSIKSFVPILSQLYPTATYILMHKIYYNTLQNHILIFYIITVLPFNWNFN
jgi:hypothetical protein